MGDINKQPYCRFKSERLSVLVTVNNALLSVLLTATTLTTLSLLRYSGYVKAVMERCTER
jgi:hypothetical protein